MILVLRQADRNITALATKQGWSVEVRDGWELTGELTLFVAAGTAIPWDLVGPGERLLRRWDVAAPLWRYGTTAADLGSPAGRKKTERIVHDLRVPAYAPELLFVRDTPDGRAFLAAYARELPGAEPRLAFLRALYQVKPLFCPLPRTWMADLRTRMTPDSRMALRAAVVQNREPLVKLEIKPGVFVNCTRGQEAATKARFARMQMTRLERRKLDANEG
ncbi:MAG TPA: hypothetical protein VM537_25400 [Anaerolineae bacterium]|nr:hypothetical protein [Anaerolineae bacterium]